MSREEMEIGLSIIKDPIFTSPPIIHETCHHHWLVLIHIPLHKLTVTHFFPIHPLYVTLNSDTHFSFFLFLSSKLQILSICGISMRFVLYQKKTASKQNHGTIFILGRIGLGWAVIGFGSISIALFILE
jgi:hypothetical protein